LEGYSKTDCYVALFDTTATSENGIDDEYKQGEMPIGKQFGYLYNVNGGISSRLLAHELGHGKFKLRHTFGSELSLSLDAKSTTNLMDYGSSANNDSLVYAQWEAIHNPALIGKPFQDDGDGAATTLQGDSWLIDEEGNANLQYENGDDVYVNSTLIKNFDFDTQEELDALSEIMTYYYDQNNLSVVLYNNKISILYYGYIISMTSNWDIDAKPYNGMIPPLAYAHSKKQYGTNANRIGVPVTMGQVSGTFGNKWGIRNAFIHEAVHLTQPLDEYDYLTYQPYFELDAYKVQMQHSTWDRTLSRFQSTMFLNVDEMLERLENSGNPETEAKYQEYLQFFNSKRP
ncbi:MAG: hypothetical protein PF484_12085, partial [Bacteroidales bacterium]|nr:hypothetical protein [Bacteroidales bacterium]